MAEERAEAVPAGAATLYGGVAPEDVFRTAQQLWAAGQLAEALRAFDFRATLPGIDQETYSSLLYAARVAAALGRERAEVIDRYVRAFEYRPSRPEALGDLARYLRQHGTSWQLGYQLARRALELPPHADGQLVEAEWAQWRCLDEFAVAAYWVGRFAECRDACERLLNEGLAPALHRPRIAENLRLARVKLGELH